jgi:hypothetical protein
LLIGLFPPLRSMLVLTMILAGLLVLYVFLLLQLRAQEVHRARVMRARRARMEAQAAQPAQFERMPVEALRQSMASSNGNGHGNGNAHSNGNGNRNGRAAHASNGNGNGYHVPEPLVGESQPGDLDDFQALLDDDVHVVVRHADPEEREALAR